MSDGDDYNVFISWSGEPSRTVATALKRWLPEVVQRSVPFASDAIEAGARWGPKLARALEQCKFGVICVTAANAKEPWLNFEAGALAKSLEESRVCPYLIGISPADLPQGPLTQFQAQRADRSGTLAMLRSINTALPGSQLGDQQLEHVFSRLWDDLEQELRRVLTASADEHPSRPVSEMIPEILDLTREISRRLPSGFLRVADEGVLSGSGTASFRAALLGKPLILATPLSGTCSCVVTSISATGFTVEVRDERGQLTYGVPVKWVALTY